MTIKKYREIFPSAPTDMHELKIYEKKIENSLRANLESYHDTGIYIENVSWSSPFKSKSSQTDGVFFLVVGFKSRRGFK